MSGFTGAIQLVYVLAAACFVVGLHLMNSPATARRGNQVSIAGMVIAGVATTAMIMPAMDTWLPRRAVAGLFIRCRPMTKHAAAST